MVDTTLKNASIPKELIMNRDETSIQLLPRADTTKSKKGSKKDRVIGMVDDKAQCTTTLHFEPATTDIIQEYDIVVNQVFKKHVRELLEKRDK
jgi:hypothetical protein